MRLYLSSFRLGRCEEQLEKLVRGGRRAAVIANATDGYPATDRADGAQRELSALGELGLDATEVDLRDYFDDRCDIGEVLRQFDLIWVRGGDVFTLRYSLARSGADQPLVELLAADEVAYGGYSAGICVLAPMLRGLESVDSPHRLKLMYDVDPIWEGLAVLDFCIVPHVDSPDHPESAACSRVAERCRSDGTLHRTLQDGEVLVVDGEREWICGTPQ